MKDTDIEKIFMVFLVIIGILYMFLASQTQMLGEDEALYYGLAGDMSHGSYPAFAPYYALPQALSPMLSLVSSPFFLIFGKSMPIIKAISAFFFLLTLVIVYLIGKKINMWLGIFSSLLLFSISLLSHLSMLAYLDAPTAFFSALVFYMMLRMKNTPDSIVLGIIMGVSFLMKSSCLLFAPILLVYGVYHRKYLKISIIALIVFAIMLAPFIMRNVMLFNYPFVEGLNVLFPEPYLGPVWLTQSLIKEISPVSLDLQLYIGSFGWLITILAVFGLSYLVSKKEGAAEEHNLLLFSAIFILVILLVFNFSYIAGKYILEQRHLTIIFPQLALLGGYFLWKLKALNKYMVAVIILILLVSVYIGTSYAVQTSTMQRYGDSYKESLYWIKGNTDKNDIVFTTYGGSLYYYAERGYKWMIDEFPQVMETNDSDYIYKTLKDKYNVSYILVWKSLVSSDYIVPKANLIGVYTYNFLNVVMQNEEKFKLVFENNETMIFKLS